MAAKRTWVQYVTSFNCNCCSGGFVPVSSVVPVVPVVSFRLFGCFFFFFFFFFPVVPVLFRWFQWFRPDGFVWCFGF